MVRKVLFVDDDQIMLLAVEKRFAAYADSFAMVMAGDGFEAVQKLKEHSISLIVLDLKMPRMDGMSLLSYSRDKYPDIPVIIVSGYRTAEMYKLAKARGVIAYISKPFQVDDLGKIILRTLQKEADGGIMHNVSPTVFLQLMEMEAKTCTIRIVDGASQKGGVLYFADGRLLDARVGEVSGIAAAYRVFTWDEVTLFIQNSCERRENRINSELQPIIMKAVGMKDEGGDGSWDEGDRDIKGSASEAELRSALQDELGDLDLPPEFFEIDENEEVAVQPAAAAPETPLAPEARVETRPQPAARGVGSGETRPGKVTKPGRAQLETVRDIIQREVGAKAGVIDIHGDAGMGNFVEYINDLGAMFNFGKLRVGHVDNGKEYDRIVVPGQPSTVVKVARKCPQEKILQALGRRRP